MLGFSVGVLLSCGETPADLLLTGAGGYRATTAMKPHTAVEFSLEARHFAGGDAVLSVQAGEVRLVGIAAEAPMLAVLCQPTDQPRSPSGVAAALW